MSCVQFLLPTRAKLVFIVEWTLFCGLLVLQRRGDVQGVIVNLVWPYLVLYLVGCLFVAVNGRPWVHLRTTPTYLIVALLVLLDQAFKLIVNELLLVGDGISLFAGGVEFANIHNPAPWLTNTLGVNIPVEVVVIPLIILLICGPLIYRFYESNYRKSFWSQMSFMFIVAAMGSCVVDYALRGYVVDYVCIPGVVAVDLKDIYSLVGVATLAIEVLDNPQISKRRSGWRAKCRETRELACRFARFVVGECTGVNRR